MTTVTFLTEGKRIIGFDAKGHSGYGDAGSDIVCAAITSAVRLVESTVNDVLATIDISDASQLSFWDSLILASAKACGCTTVYSEDLNDGQTINGVKVVNPFR